MPVHENNTIRISYGESPAHVGALKNSIDFIASEGTPVLAAADGIVIDVKDDSEIGGTEKKFEKYGNFVEILHEHGECSEYEHLRKNVIVKIGDKVKKRQVIAYSGATGWLAHLGPHLHFMVGIYGKTDKDYKTLEIVFEHKTGV